MDTRTIGSRSAIVAALLAAFLALALWHSTPAKAAEFTVDDGDVAGLKTAINAANSNGEANTIRLAANGTYTLTAVDNTETTGNGIAFNGLPMLTTEISIVGNGATIQRSDAEGTPAFRILRVSDDGNLTLEGTTISGGDSGNRDGGGGIFSRGILTVSDSTFSQNTGADGGGIQNVFGEIEVSDSTFTGNTANRQGGSGEGGAIHTFARDIVISGSTFSENSASLNGGAVYHDSSDGSFSGSGSTFSENSAGRNGGGLYHQRGALTVSGSTFSGNTANGEFDFQGGGIFAENEGLTDGSGIPIEDPEDRTTITNSTFTGNEATGTDGASGGAIQNTFGLTEINFSTITTNTAQSGGVDSTATRISSSIVVGNSSDVDNMDGTRPYESGGSNLIGDGERAADFDGTEDRTGVTVAEAFGTESPSLEDNGGPTKTLALEDGAEAINAANPNAFPATDQRGVKRPQGDAPDVGAFEVEVDLAVIEPRLTFGGKPSTIYQPRNVMRMGKLIAPPEYSVANRRIVLFSRTEGTRFTPIRATTTDANGRYEFRGLRPRVDTFYLARYVGNPDEGLRATGSPVRKVNVRIN
ncbi:MAG: choice-of-anchor Q domain-containing protein [Rubrobacteraceae bacterium]